MIFMLMILVFALQLGESGFALKVMDSLLIDYPHLFALRCFRFLH